MPEGHLWGAPQPESSVLPKCRRRKHGSRAEATLRDSHLSGDAVKVLPQHPSHVLPGVGRHLMLEQEGELAALADAVEVAVDLVVFAAWEETGKESQIAQSRQPTTGSRE